MRFSFAPQLLQSKPVDSRHTWRGCHQHFWWSYFTVIGARSTKSTAGAVGLLTRIHPHWGARIRARSRNSFIEARPAISHNHSLPFAPFDEYRKEQNQTNFSHRFWNFKQFSMRIRINVTRKISSQNFRQRSENYEKHLQFPSAFICSEKLSASANANAKNCIQRKPNFPPTFTLTHRAKQQGDSFSTCVYFSTEAS